MGGETYLNNGNGGFWIVEKLLRKIDCEAATILGIRLLGHLIHGIN